MAEDIEMRDDLDERLSSSSEAQGVASPVDTQEAPTTQTGMPEGDQDYQQPVDSEVAFEAPAAPAQPYDQRSQAAMAGHPYEPATPAAQPFVRQRAPHRTQPPVNDTDFDNTLGRDLPHDSGYTLQSRRVRGGSRTYSRSRTDINRARKELKYGQLLSVPKGNHEIFSTRDRTRHKQLLVGLVAVVLIAIVVALFVLLPH